MQRSFLSYTGHSSHSYQASLSALICALWLLGVILFRIVSITRSVIVFSSDLYLLCGLLAAEYSGINPGTKTIGKVT